MPKARLYFDGDDGIQKDSRIYKLRDDIAQKIENVPTVIDNTSSSSRTDALSANMGRDLQEQINNLAARGRYLSTRNAVTGLPDTQPQTNPYVYRAGDYYIVSNIGVTNYRPQGASYTIGVASTAQEHAAVNVNDLYIYDGANWVLQGSTSTSVAWGSIVGNIANQGDLQNELNDKADVADVLTKTNTTSYTPTADYHPATKKYSDDNDTYIGTSAPTDNVVEGRLWYDTTNDILKVYNGSQWVPTGKTYTAGRNIAISNADVISATGLQEKLIAGENVTIETECFRSDKGPCPDGFHIATWAWSGAPYSGGWDLADIGKLNDYLATLGVTDMSATMKFPNLRYWAPSQSTSHTRPNICVGWYIRSTSSGTSFGWGWVANPSEERHIRPVKDTPVIPDGSSSWVTLFDGSSIATDAGVFWNEDEGIISVSSDGTNWITVADKNLGATQVWNSGDTLTAANAGNLYQRGNNFGRPYGTTPTTTSEQVDVSSYGPQDYYYREVKFTSSPWVTANNPDLRGWPTPYGARTICQPKISATDTGQTYTAGVGINIDANNEISADTTVLATQTDLTNKQDKMAAGKNITIGGTLISAKDTEYTAGSNITITCSTKRDTQGPCPDGFHVPLSSEWQTIINDVNTLSIDTGGYGETGNFNAYFKLPRAGELESNGNLNFNGVYGYYWCADRDTGGWHGVRYFHSFYYGIGMENASLNLGYVIRPFKDDPAIPDNSWTTLYDGSSVATGAGIFWDQTNGLISISSDGTTWTTVADKNLGATSTWEHGAAYYAHEDYAEQYCGKHFQWGNNYPFPHGTPEKIASQTVDLTGYGPGNYYISNIYNPSRNVGSNNNVWGGVTQGTWQDCEHPIISAAGGATYTAGNGINIDQNDEISIDTTVVATQTDLASKQDTLTAGENIQIDTATNTISATDTTYNAGDNITIEDICTTESDMKGPCSDGFHIGTLTERETLGGYLTTFNVDSTYYKMPTSGGYKLGGQIQSNFININDGCYFWSATGYDNTRAKVIITGTGISNYSLSINSGANVRPFKNTPVVPDSNWTTLYDGSSVATGAGIFWDSSEGLISVSVDGTNWTTIADKSIGATQVYNSGDTLTEENTGYVYQWGNNYGFTGRGKTWTEQTTNDARDLTGYGPGNYYYSNVASNAWGNPINYNARGGVTQGTFQDCIYNVISAADTTYTAGAGINIDANNEISNTGVTSVNGRTGAVVTFYNQSTPPLSAGNGDFRWVAGTGNGFLQVRISGDWVRVAPDEVIVSASTPTTPTPTEGKLWYDTSNDVLKSYDGTNWNTVNTDTTYTAGAGINIDVNNEISNTLPGPTIAATAPTGTEGALWYDTTNDVLMAHNGTAWKEAGTQMKVLSYGHSTWQDFIDAYNENAIVYCKTSSNSNPGSGNQGRMAFMAFIDINSTTQEIQGVEFQYYRSRSSHSTAANVLDEVYIYKLTPASGGTWTVTQRDTAAKPIAGTGIGLTYNSSGMTISADTTVLATQTDLATKQDTLVSGTDIKTINNQSLLGSGDISINGIVSGALVPPASSQWEGRIFYCTFDNTFYKCDGTTWTEIGSGNITNDVTGTTSTVTKVWAGTQTEYNALSSYDSTTIYYIV